MADGFMVKSIARDGLECLFEDDGETGYLYLIELATEEIINDLHIYTRPIDPTVSEEDVNFVWSDQGPKWGVTLEGFLYGYFDLGSKSKVRPQQLGSKLIPVTEDAARSLFGIE